MGILNQLKALFAASGSDSNTMWLYVRCARCGAPLAVRVDLRNEPSIDYETGGYVLHKEMMDNKCFLLMHAEVRFDDKRNVTERKVDKGEFITPEEYQAMTNEQVKK